MGLGAGFVILVLLFTWGYATNRMKGHIIIPFIGLAMYVTISFVSSKSHNHDLVAVALGFGVSVAFFGPGIDWTRKSITKNRANTSNQGSRRAQGQGQGRAQGLDGQGRAPGQGQGRAQGLDGQGRAPGQGHGPRTSPQTGRI